MYQQIDRKRLAAAIAQGVLAGRWAADAIAENGAGCLDRWPAWMDALAMYLVAVHRVAPAGPPDALAITIERFLADRPDELGSPEPPGITWLVPTELSANRDARPRSRNRSRLARGSIAPTFAWPVAPLPSPAALATALELDDGQLAWLADVRGLERSAGAERLRNYRYRTLPRPGGLPRVIEVPKARLKEIQRWILREILDRIPPHPAAHGFVRGRSAITHAQCHVGRDMVLSLDLRDFFASVAAGRIYGVFTTAGYPPAVAHLLTGLTTNVVPRAVSRPALADTEPALVAARSLLARRLSAPHLPQGAPTSPALANLAAFALDRRLTGLATVVGASYSRYADDMTFSGSGAGLAAWLAPRAARIAAAEGFVVHHAKTAARGAARRQQVCGVVVNVRPNVVRAEYDQLKAILHNAARRGPASQNRDGHADFEAHLRGRVAWVASVHPDRGATLRRRLQAIDFG